MAETIRKLAETKAGKTEGNMEKNSSQFIQIGRNWVESMAVVVVSVWQ